MKNKGNKFAMKGASVLSTQLQIRISADIKKKCIEQAKSENKNLSEWINSLIREKIDET